MGHTRSQCPIIHTEDPSKPCTMCGDFGHVAATCHQIWRYYMPIERLKWKCVGILRGIVIIVLCQDI